MFDFKHHHYVYGWYSKILLSRHLKVCPMYIVLLLQEMAYKLDIWRPEVYSIPWECGGVTVEKLVVHKKQV